jgi:hypothetical protein
VDTDISQQFITRVQKESVCGYRNMSAVCNESSEKESMWIQAYVSKL